MIEGMIPVMLRQLLSTSGARSLTPVHPTLDVRFNNTFDALNSNYVRLGNMNINQWTHYTAILTDAKYMLEDFKVQFIYAPGAGDARFAMVDELSSGLEKIC